MQQEEIWKDVPGYEGLYQASNLGRIKSDIKIKNQTKSKSKKYLMVYLYKQNVKKNNSCASINCNDFFKPYSLWT